MRSSKPPAQATWLLRHAIPGSKSEALAGDLLEQFGEGRSAAWYWRQTLIALFVGLSKQLRILWMAVAFTLVWASALSLFYGRNWFTAQALAIFVVGIRRPYPKSLIYAITCFTALNALPLPMALGAYLWVTRSFSLGRFSRGILVGLFSMAQVIFLGLALSPTLRHPGLVTHVVGSLPVFFALVLSMWAARPNQTGRRTATISG